MGWKAAGAARMLTDFTSARSMFVSLHTADPQAANELTGNAYARLELHAADWTVASASVSEGGERRLKATNTAAENFATPTGAWGDPTHVALNPAAAGFAPYATAALASNVDAPQSGATVRFNANDLSLYIVTDD